MPSPGDFPFGPGDPRYGVLQRHARFIAAGGDPDTPLTAAHAFSPPVDLTPAQGLGLLAAMGLVLLSGFASGRITDWLGVRAFALVLLVFAAAATFQFGGITVGGHRSIPVVERLVLFAALGIAVATGMPMALWLLPAVVHGAVARLMFESLDGDMSFIETAARVFHPLAPDFIRPYCRALTRVWAALFALSAAVIAVCAIAGWTHAHRVWTTWMFWSLLGGFSFVEFFWRKAWFRYYGRGPIDRALARVFPPERTARGRRSEAYLMQMRAELARLAETERTRLSR